MPIQINLLTEAQAAEDFRRRDPVKRAIFGGSLLVALSLVWFSSILLAHMIASSNLAQVEANIQMHTNDYNVVVVNLKKVTDVKNHLDALQKFNSSRFLQGNLLNSLQQLYVPNVRLLRLQIQQGYTRKDTPAGKAGTITSITEHTTLLLDAKDSGPNPGDQVNHYKDALGQIDFFKNNLDPNNDVKLSNLSAPQLGIDNKPFVLFTVECRFPDQTR
jgi:hypothetical protein